MGAFGVIISIRKVCGRIATLRAFLSPGRNVRVAALCSLLHCNSLSLFTFSVVNSSVRQASPFKAVVTSLEVLVASCKLPGTGRLALIFLVVVACCNGWCGRFLLQFAALRVQEALFGWSCRCVQRCDRGTVERDR